jgi:hypothetical protein
VKLPRISIAKLMLLVAIIAANLAVGRVLGAYHLVLPVAIALTGLAVQAGGERSWPDFWFSAQWR